MVWSSTLSSGTGAITAGSAGADEVFFSHTQIAKIAKIAKMGKQDEASVADGGGAGFPVGATLVARWMGQTERTCVVVDRRAF